MIVEIHFQEGFSNEKAQLLVNGDVVEEFSLNTRFQLGMAAIKKVDATPGTKVQVVLPGRDIRQQLPVGHPYVKVSLEDGKLTISSTDQMPGYL
jgi:hypothetical protein